MATSALRGAPGGVRDDRFFLLGAFVMAAAVVAGFGLKLALGRSSFSAPLVVHAHGIIAMGWVALYLAQNILAANGNMALHRRLGWIAAAWLVPMLASGIAVTVAAVQRGRVPFFFLPQQFLVFDPMTLVAFAALTIAAIALHRRTDWHRRLHFCGTAMVIAPAFGRLLPLPMLRPYAFEATMAAVLLFPIAGVVADLRRRGRVHPAWLAGLATMLGAILLIEAMAYGPVGAALYARATAGTPGAQVAPLAFGPPPPVRRP